MNEELITIAANFLNKLILEIRDSATYDQREGERQYEIEQLFHIKATLTSLSDENLIKLLSNYGYDSR
ncbi:hypothetical protein [Bacterioplanoides pacificum]|uniref:Uncharacterized protein n=1 Tax=Bacterioplanoides pacificum TaxID=1171596 RepID=A0ABV7VVU1_9GAMM